MLTNGPGSMGPEVQMKTPVVPEPEYSYLKEVCSLVFPTSHVKYYTKLQRNQKNPLKWQLSPGRQFYKMYGCAVKHAKAKMGTGVWLTLLAVPWSRALDARTFCFPHSSTHENMVQTTLTPILAATIAESKKGDKMTRWALPVGQPLVVQEGWDHRVTRKEPELFCGVRSTHFIMRKLPSQIKTVWSGGMCL